jgi:hypothetical protein
MSPSDDLVSKIMQVHSACLELGLSTREELDVLQWAWLAVASNARTEALGIPGGFPEERARQVTRLHAMADEVARDQPDLEMERLYQEGDDEGMHRHIMQLLRGTKDGPATDTGEKGGV